MMKPIRIHAIGQAMDNGRPNTSGSGERNRDTTGQVTASTLSRNTPIASRRIRDRFKSLLCGGQRAVCDTLVHGTNCQPEKFHKGDLIPKMTVPGGGSTTSSARKTTMSLNGASLNRWQSVQ